MDPEYVLFGSAPEASAYMQRTGTWTVGSLRQSIGWTTEPVTIRFSGKTLLLLPEDENYLPAVAAIGGRNECRRLILEFASSLAWSEVGDVTIEHWTGGSRIFRVSKKKLSGQVTAARFQIDYLPAPTDARQKLALALFHEGIGLANINVAYSFLSFYKIVNLVSGTGGRDQTRWINGHIAQMTHRRSLERLQELQKQNVDIGSYIYESCRCAIAHASDPTVNPVIDPHNLEDQNRLHSDLPLVISLAELAIEGNLGIKTSQTVYQEHRYELSGFEPLISPNILEQIKQGATLEAAEISNLPRMSIRLQGKSHYKVFENLIVSATQINNGIVNISGTTTSTRYTAIINLNFPAYRLTVDIVSHVTTDEGTANYLEELIEVERFFWQLNTNGCLEVWQDNGDCLGRCDAYIPVNVMFQPKAHETRLTKLNDELERRKKREGK